MSLDTWKVEKGLCRCCHDDGNHTNLAQPHLQKGQQEIYANIMQQCFNINLHPVPGPLCTVTYTICDLCAQRLLDAFSFKQQVMQCEERFHNLYNQNMIKLRSNYEIDIKVEISDEDVVDVKPVICVQVDENNDYEFDNEDDDGDDSKDMSLDTEEEQSTTSQPKKPKVKPKAKGQTRKSERTVKAKQNKEAKAKKELKLLPDVAHCVEVIEDSGKKKLKCTKCLVERRYAHDMRRHIESAHKNEPVYGVIPQCEVIEENGEKKYKCTKCRVELRHPDDMRRHIESTHKSEETHITVEDMADYKEIEMDGKKKFRCNMCDAVRCNAQLIQSHMLVDHFNVIPFKCFRCPQKYQQKRALLAHLANKHNLVEVDVNGTKVLQESTKAVCDICKKEYNGEWLLSLHMRTHKGPKCPECSQVIRGKKMAFHRHKVHGVPIPTCGICGLQGVTEYFIMRHQRQVHMRERTLQCPKCDLKVFSQVELKKHFIKHNPVKKYECRFCKKTFPRLCTKTEHEKIHTGVKNKVCTICDQRFVQKASLNYHMMKHHPEVPF